MAANILPDSSFFISRIRTGRDPFAEMALYADDNDFFTCGVVVTEVLRCFKQMRPYQKAASTFSYMLFVPTSNALWQKVARLAWEMDRLGKVMQVTDLLIAASALEADAAVLTLDSDFYRVPNLRVLRDLS